MHYRAGEVEHTLDMENYLEPNEASWSNQKIALTFFSLVFIILLLGYFGKGILSRQKTETAGNLVEYQHYGRFKKDATMHFKASNINGAAVVHIPQEYFQHFTLERITPEPNEQKLVNGHYEYTFLTRVPVHILMSGAPKKTGGIKSKVKINDTEFELSQFIFP